MNTETFMAQAALHCHIIESIQNVNEFFREKYTDLQNYETSNILEKINRLRAGAITLSIDFLNNETYKNVLKSILRTKYDRFGESDKILINNILSEFQPLSDVTLQKFLENYILQSSYHNLFLLP